MTTPMVVLLVVVLFIAWIYNRLMRLRNRMRAAWSQIDVQLRRRQDLIPNLLASVQGFMAHERMLLQRIAETRAQAVSAGGDVARRVGIESNLDASLVSLVALVQAAPDIRADHNALMLQEELRSTESRIAFARQHYNECVADYNTAIACVPANVVSTICAFKPAIQFFTPDFSVTGKAPVPMPISRT
jgi:LemA protein